SGVLQVASSQGLGSPAGGTVVANNATLQLAGDITVAGESLVIQGSGPQTSAPYAQAWFNQGPAPITPGLTQGSLPTTGRLNAIAVDPTNANVIYVAAAGGGAWKTMDGGVTWHPLLD